MENIVVVIATSYFFVISSIGMIVMVVDKKKAEKKQWRISERALLTIGLLGGATLMYIVSRVIRHKTNKPKFVIGLPAMAAFQVVVIMYWFL